MKTQDLVAGLVSIALMGLALACDRGNPPSAPATSKINASSRHFSASEREGDHRSAREGDQRFRWDIISVDFATGTLSAGGMASAAANDGSKITLTGSGTFGVGEDDGVTGGGHWTTFNETGSPTGGGTDKGTRLVSWGGAPGPPAPPH